MDKCLFCKKNLEKDFYENKQESFVVKNTMINI